MTTQNNDSNFGVNVWWTCPEFVLDGEKAQQALTSNGFETEDMPLPSRRNEVSRAAYSFQDRRHKDGRRVTEKAKDNSDKVVYGILGRTQDGEEVGYTQATKVTLDKESGRVEVNGELANHFDKALSVYSGAITDADVRMFLRKVIAMTYGVAKRPSGGIYFVPNRFMGIIESAQRVLAALNVGAKLYVERVVDGAPERSLVWDSVEMSVGSDIDTILSAVENIGKRASAVRSHEAKLSELESYMNVYRQLLGEEAKYEELSEKIKDATSKVTAKMTALNDAENGKKAVKVTASGSKVRRKRGTAAKMLEDIEKVLSDLDKPIHYRELTTEMVARGIEMHETPGADTAEWVYTTLWTAVRHGDTRFEAVGRGIFATA